MIFAPILIIFLTFGCDFYLCFTLVRNWSLIAKLALFVPTILFFICAFLALRGNWGWALMLMIGLVLCVLVPKLLICLFSLFGKVGGLAYGPLACWMNKVGMILAGIVCLCGLYGVGFGWKHLVVKEVSILAQSLPESFRGYRIVQISDLHLGTFGKDVAHIRRMVEKINSLKPDLIVFTGDLVNFTYEERVCQNRRILFLYCFEN